MNKIYDQQWIQWISGWVIDGIATIQLEGAWVQVPVSEIKFISEEWILRDGDGGHQEVAAEAREIEIRGKRFKTLFQLNNDSKENLNWSRV